MNWNEEMRQKDKNWDRDIAEYGGIDTFLARVEGALKAKKVSRSELSKRLDVSPANVTRVFGSSNPTWSTIFRIAWALGFEAEIRLKPRRDGGR